MTRRFVDYEEFLDGIRDKLFAYRRKHKLSQSNFLKNTGIDKSTFSRFQSGQRGIHPDKLMKLIFIAELTLDDILNKE